MTSILLSIDEVWYGLHINCGGGEYSDGDITYEGDTGEAMFQYNRASHWAVSSTGHFLNNEASQDKYTLSKTAADVQPNTSLYTSARVSPLSLTYYGYCFGNGNYTVVLHFAEIAFETGQLFSTLMRRVFHVYIQGTLVLKDFDIVVKAGSVGKGINVTFPAVVVSNNTMEIRFYWAGRGKTGIPWRTFYGPLISAISVNPEFKPPPENKSSITTGAIVGIVAAVIVIFSVVGFICWKYFLKPYRMKIDLRSLDLQSGTFSLRQLKAATNDFDLANKIGEGGFGSVYKGLLSDGTVIAVKQLSSKSKQGNREFLNEVGLISGLQHPHLVKLYGCCIEGNQLLLVYEYMENNCLARALFGREDYKLELDWPTRHKICVGIARGLAYLHEESRLKIVHRDIKATNVLLDKNLNPKISDFGLAKLDDEDNTHISTRIAGTFGYMAPEYAMRGYLTDKADVYSFGIVALELVSGRSNTSFKTKEDSFYLLDWALILKEKGQLMDLVDPRLGSSFNKKQVITMIKVALLCVNVSPAVRPSMSSVVSMLEGQAHIHEVDTEPSICSSEMTLKFEIESSQEQSLMDRQVYSDAPWTGSSVSDLYPLNLYSVTSVDKTD